MAIDAQTRHEIEQMLALYWREIDQNETRNILDFYTDDCRYEIDAQMTFAGKVELAGFYRTRASWGYRLTRHCMANLLLEDGPDGLVKASFTMTNYGDIKPPPVTDLQAPAMVCDVECLCRKEAGETWRIQSFRGIPVFIGPDTFSRAVLVDDEDVDGG